MPITPLPSRSRRRPPAQVVSADRELASQSESELIARVLGGPEPAAQLLHLAAALSAIPFWRRRALGACGLMDEHGVPIRQAIRLAALWELAERWYPDERPTVATPRDALLLLEGLRSAPTERVVVLMLDARHRPLGTELVAVGALNAARLCARDVLAPALRAGAAAVILAHNHVTGDATPSVADRQVTSALRSACAVVGVPLLDHVIVTRHGHHSFRDTEDWEDAA